MGVSLSGVFSGMDTDSIVSQLMTIESRYLTALSARKSTEQKKQSAVADLEARLGALKTAADRLRDADAMRVSRAASSDGDVLTGSAGAGAAEGAVSVVVNQLATVQKRIQTTGLAALTSSVGASKSTAVNAHTVADADAVWLTAGQNGSTYTFDFGSQTGLDGVTFAPDTGYSMNQVAALINARSQALAGYDAAGVELDNGQYRLRLTAKDNGPVGALEVSLTAGDALAELNDQADWTAADGLAGDFSYTYGGATRTIHTAAGTTLAGLRDLINNDGANPGVSASLLQYNSAWHLVLSGGDTGLDNVITINDAQTTLAGFDSADIPQTQAARNAQVRVDGFPAEGWLERASNTLTDVVDNVTINLQGAGSASLTLTRNTDDLKGDLTNLVEVYNGLADKIKAYAGYDAKTKTSGLLQGDSMVSSLLAQVRQALVTTAPGFVTGSDTYTLAGEIGLSFDKTGKLSLDSDALDEALSDNYQGVLALLGAAGSGGSDSSSIQFGGATEATVAGSYQVEVDFDAAGAVTTARIRTVGEVGWRWLGVNGSSLIAGAGTSEAGLLLSAVSDGTPGPHTQTATVRVRRGLGGMIYRHAEGLLDSVTGRIANRKTQLASNLERIDREMELQQKRLDSKQKRLKQQYARLEATLAQMDLQRGSLQSMLLNMTSGNSGNS